MIAAATASSTSKASFLSELRLAETKIAEQREQLQHASTHHEQILENTRAEVLVRLQRAQTEVDALREHHAGELHDLSALKNAEVHSAMIAVRKEVRELANTKFNEWKDRTAEKEEQVRLEMEALKLRLEVASTPTQQDSQRPCNGCARCDIEIANLRQKYAQADINFAEYAQADIKFADLAEKYAQADVKFADLAEKHAQANTKIAELTSSKANSVTTSDLNAVNARYDSEVARTSQLIGSLEGQLRLCQSDLDKSQIDRETERDGRSMYDEQRRRTSKFAHEEQVKRLRLRIDTLEQGRGEQQETRQSKQHSYSSRDTEQFDIFGKDGMDDYDEYYDEDDPDYDGDWTEPVRVDHRPKSTPKVFAGQTQTQTRTPNYHSLGVHSGARRWRPPAAAP